MVNALEAFGIRVEAAHHEVAAGQHEIDFRVRRRPQDRRQRRHLQVHPQGHRQPARPVRDVHAQADLRHQRLGHAHPPEPLLDRRASATRSPTASNKYGLSDLARSYMAGILAHARGMIAVLAPTVNSLQAAGARLRGADLPDLGPHQPLRAHPRAQGLARACSIEATRVEVRCPDPVLEHLPGLRRACWRPAWTASRRGSSWPTRSRRASSR